MATGEQCAQAAQSDLSSPWSPTLSDVRRENLHYTLNPFIPLGPQLTPWNCSIRAPQMECLEQLLPPSG